MKISRQQIAAYVSVQISGGSSGAAVPVNSILAAELDRAPGHDAVTILASSKGTPWTYDGFSSGWHRFKRKLEKAEAIGPGLTPKGLRHTMATWLREAGQDERNISDLLAQKSKVMGLHYSKDASLARKNKQTMEVWEKENERRSKVVKPITNVSHSMVFPLPFERALISLDFPCSCHINCIPNYINTFLPQQALPSTNKRPDNFLPGLLKEVKWA